MPRYGVSYYLDRTLHLRVDATDEVAARLAVSTAVDEALAELSMVVEEATGEQDGVVEIQELKE